MHEGPDMESRLDDALDRAGGYVRRGGVAVLMGGGGRAPDVVVAACRRQRGR